METPQITPTQAPPAKAVTLQPIVFATDFSPASKGALAKAIEAARKEGAELIVAHVYGPPASLSHSGLADDLIEAELETTIRRDVEKQMEPVLETARAAGVRVRGEILAGHVAKQLADLAVRSGAAMVVIGTHGRTGIKRLVMGSVAGQVVATAPCPVLTVH
ncbi:MAG TPA: universal stress protein [Thermoanaerobaculia bacterium]|nr:universal stress protein [Thermoanaerobaculia bacterium]